MPDTVHSLGSPVGETATKTSIDMGGALKISDIRAIALNEATPVFGVETTGKINGASELLENLIARGDQIYGVTTGFGPLARYQLPQEDVQEVQRNLVYHLASGVGPAFERATARAIMACRLSSLSKGFSGISLESANLLRQFLEFDITPAIPCRGTVGASGDLTPLAHIALAMMGEGKILPKESGRPDDAFSALIAANLKPMTPRNKDALALVNGTAAMTGVAALNGANFEHALLLQEKLSAIDILVNDAPREAYHSHLAAVRPHAGQRESANHINALLQTEARPDERTSATGRYEYQGHPHQEEYSLRCVIQELGAARDVLAFHNQVVTTEINSVTDNPILCPEEGRVIHGGNFYGQHVGYASDSLMAAVIKLSVFAERVVARLCNPARNKGLPPFLTPERVGIHSGLMGAQVTATALIAEMRSEAIPASIQSISTNNDNQDVVTMGTIAARKVARLQEMMWQVMAIETIALMQALELKRLQAILPAPLVGFYEDIRAVSPALKTDRPLSDDIAAVSARLQSMV